MLAPTGKRHEVKVNLSLILLIPIRLTMPLSEREKRPLLKLRDATPV